MEGSKAVEGFINVQGLADMADKAVVWLALNVFTLASLAQLGVAIAAGALAFWLKPTLRALGRKMAERIPPAIARSALRPALHDIVAPLTWFLLLNIAEATAVRLELPSRILTVAMSLVGVWMVIRLAASLIRDPMWARLLTSIAWVVAALNILGLLNPVIALLDGMAITLGDFRLSVMLVLKAAATLGLLLWGAITLSRLAERRIQGMTHLTVSARALFSKMLHIGLLVVAVMVALNAVGIDLTALAVFGGAIGLGLGFGLQKVVSNLVSGIILLLDRSVKPGDVIALGSTYGKVDAIGARYVSVVTRDGIEHLIPNEELITTRVENWSYSDTRIRVRIPIGISYDSDPHAAITIAENAARAVPRVQADPPPRCLLSSFGDNSVNLELRVWINDPEGGVGSVASAVRLALWDAFREHGIAIPYPQRSLHFPDGPIDVRVTPSRHPTTAD